MYMKNLPIMKRGKVTGLANVVNSASADLSIATMVSELFHRVTVNSFWPMRPMKIYNICLSWELLAEELGILSTLQVVVFLTSPSALPQARQCPRAGQRDFLKSTFCCCTEGEGCTKHFKRDLAPGEGRRVVSSGVFRVL